MRLFIDSVVALLLAGVLTGVLFHYRGRPRLLVNSLMALLLIGVLASVLLYQRERQNNQRRHDTVHLALSRLRDKALLFGALDFDVHDPNGNAYPLEVSPTWFREEGLPMNVMVPGWQPWIDLAPAGDLSDQPPDPVITRSDQAGFWYNPNNGVFRARVVPQHSDRATLDLYNELNNTSLAAIVEANDEARQPQPLFPTPAFSESDSSLSAVGVHPRAPVSHPGHSRGRPLSSRR